MSHITDYRGVCVCVYIYIQTTKLLLSWTFSDCVESNAGLEMDKYKPFPVETLVNGFLRHIATLYKL